MNVPRNPQPAHEVALERARLLDVALELFERDGSDAMSFRAIANRAGCSHTKPYSYFDSKADIIDALRVRAYEWVFGVISTAAAFHDAPLDALSALAEAYVQAALDRPRMYELLYTADGAVSEVDPQLYEAKVAALGVCRDVIAAAAEAGDLDLATDPLTAAHVFWAGAHGVVELALGGFLVVGLSVEQLTPQMLSVLMAGLTEGRTK